MTVRYSHGAKILALLLLVLSLPLTTFANYDRFKTKAESILWISEQYPPFHYLEKGELKGIAVDVLLDIFNRKNVNVSKKDILVYPWARGYHTLLSDDSSAMITMAYTQERSELFKFAGPIVPSRISILAKAERNIKLKDIEDLKNYVIGVVRSDIGESLLYQLEIEPLNLVQVKESVSMLKMLLLDRVDIIAYAEEIVQFQLPQIDEHHAELERLMLLKNSHINFAFNNKIPSWFVKEMQKELDEMHQSGKITELSAKYFPSQIK